MKKKYIILLAVLGFIIVLIVAGFIFISQIESNHEAINSTAVTDVDLSPIKDGVYTGSYSAFPISVKVEVTINDHSITKIELLEFVNGQGSVAEVISEHVVKAQSLKVDTVSGATLSSKVILLAIQNALSAAQ